MSDLKHMAGPASLAVAELEGTPEFQRYVIHLRAHVTSGESVLQLSDATSLLVDMCRVMLWGPTTIITALHRAGLGVSGKASEDKNELETRRYSTALDVLLYWYLRE